MTSTGPALCIVTAVDRNNGDEVLQRLFQRHEPETGPRLQNMMTRILRLGDLPKSSGGVESAFVDPGRSHGPAVKIAVLS